MDRDTLTEVLKVVGWRERALACCVSRSWRKAAFDAAASVSGRMTCLSWNSESFPASPLLKHVTVCDLTCYHLPTWIDKLTVTHLSLRIREYCPMDKRTYRRKDFPWAWRNPYIQHLDILIEIEASDEILTTGSYLSVDVDIQPHAELPEGVLKCLSIQTRYSGAPFSDGREIWVEPQLWIDKGVQFLSVLSSYITVVDGGHPRRVDYTQLKISLVGRRVWAVFSWDDMEQPLDLASAGLLYDSPIVVNSQNVTHIATSLSVAQAGFSLLRSKQMSFTAEQ